MTVYDAEPAQLDLHLPPADQSVTITFNAGALDVTGVWEFAVRDAYAADLVRLAPVVVTTAAADGVLVVPFTETALLALIGQSNDAYQGVYTLQRDTLPVIGGTFRVSQKATRD